MAKWDDYGIRFLELRTGGKSYEKISKLIPVSVTTLKRWGGMLSVQIQELKDLRVSAFVQENVLVQERRLELVGEQVARMQDELADRDLREMTVEQLLRLYLRYLDGIRKEVEPVRVEVSNTVVNYENILEKILAVPEGMTKEDIPDLAEELGADRGPTLKVAENVPES